MKNEAKSPIRVNVLGVDYAVEFRMKSEDSDLERADGYCDTSTKSIVVRGYTEEEKKDPLSLKNLEQYQKKVVRHELVHAFLYESGLSVNTNGVDSWASNEEMTDWIAIQGPKLYEAWKEAEAL